MELLATALPISPTFLHLACSKSCAYYRPSTQQVFAFSTIRGLELRGEFSKLPVFPGVLIVLVFECDGHIRVPDVSKSM